MKHITFGVPEKEDFIRWFKILRFKLTGGFSCKKCGEKSDFDCVQFNSKAKDTRLLFHNHTAGICAECTKDELNDNADIVYNNVTVECDWCNEVKPTASFIQHKDMDSFVTFGCQWWNGHNICQSCMNDGIDNRGPTYSSHSKHENGKTYQRNELGMWIKIK